MLSHFANPWGLLALLGIPAVLAIHFLQRRVRVIPVSTLFLLESTRDDTVAGRKLRRLVPSIPLWLQLLAVLLLAALLAEPRWPWKASVQRVAIVLDDSASMMVFKKEVADAVRLTASQASGLAARAEFLLLPADPAKPRVHAGGNAQAAIQALESWQPAGGPVNPAPSLRLAREQVGRSGPRRFPFRHACGFPPGGRRDAGHRPPRAECRHHGRHHQIRGRQTGLASHARQPLRRQPGALVAP